MKSLIASLRLVIVTMLICVGGYTALILGFAQIVTPDTAEGSLIKDKDGKIVGSRLIAQKFTQRDLFLAAAVSRRLQRRRRGRQQQITDQLGSHRTRAHEHDRPIRRDRRETAAGRSRGGIGRRTGSAHHRARRAVSSGAGRQSAVTSRRRRSKHSSSSRRSRRAGF